MALEFKVCFCCGESSLMGHLTKIKYSQILYNAAR